MKKALATAAVALGMALGTVAASGGAAYAGERGGNGEATPINDYRANSICSFSGLDDLDFLAPVEPGVVQNWGTIPREVRDYLAGIGEHPGTACNGHLHPLHP